MSCSNVPQDVAPTQVGVSEGNGLNCPSGRHLLKKDNGGIRIHFMRRNGFGLGTISLAKFEHLGLLTDLGPVATWFEIANDIGEPVGDVFPLFLPLHSRDPFSLKHFIRIVTALRDNEPVEIDNVTKRVLDFLHVDYQTYFERLGEVIRDEQRDEQRAYANDFNRFAPPQDEPLWNPRRDEMFARIALEMVVKKNKPFKTMRQQYFRDLVNPGKRKLVRASERFNEHDFSLTLNPYDYEPMNLHFAGEFNRTEMILHDRNCAAMERLTALKRTMKHDPNNVVEVTEEEMNEAYAEFLSMPLSG
jgi:hypothetical protein